MSVRLLALLLMCLPLSVIAGDLRPMSPWIREAPPTARVLAGFAMLHNESDRERRLVAVESDDFERVEMHRTLIENGMARMLPQASLMIPAQGMLRLAPGGLHLMLIGPRRALAEGDRVTLTLRFADGESLPVTFEVRRGRGGGTDHSRHSHH